MPEKDMSILNDFLKEFVDGVTEKHSEKIDFIILSGSASRGNFRIGKSDLDLGIRTKSHEDIELIRKDATELFWKLDGKYNMQFHNVLISKDFDYLFPSLSKKTTKEPFQIYGPNYDPRRNSFFWKLNFIHGYGKELLRETLKYGHILYGNNEYLEDLARKEKYINNSWDTFFTFNFFRSIAMVPVFLISADFALIRSIRSVFYTYDGFPGSNLKIAEYAKYNFNLVRKEWPYLKKAIYCLKAPFLIARQNLRRVKILRGNGASAIGRG